MDNYMNRMEEEFEVPENMNPFQRIANLFFSPKKLFSFLRKKPSVLLPIIIISIGTFLHQLILFEPTKDMQMDLRYNTYKQVGMSFTPDQLETLVNAQAIGGLIASPIVGVAAWLVSSLIMYAIFRLVNCEKGLKKYFSMIGYISILSVISQLIHAGFLRYSGGDLLSPAVTSLASMLDSETLNPLLFGIASGLEVFNIWTFILYGIGFAYTGGVEKKKSYIMAGILFAVVLLITAGSSVLSAGLLSGGIFGSLTGS